MELGTIVGAVTDGSISRAQGRPVLADHAENGGRAAEIIAARGFRLITDDGALAAAVEQVLAANAAAVADYRAGNGRRVGFLVGQVMKATGGQANAALAQAAVRRRLDSPDGEET